MKLKIEGKDQWHSFEAESYDNGTVNLEISGMGSYYDETLDWDLTPEQAVKLADLLTQSANTGGAV